MTDKLLGFEQIKKVVKTFYTPPIIIHSNPNLLINHYFLDPINQRGLTEYTTLGYSIDMWRIGGAATNIKYNVESATLSCDPTTDTYALLEQLLDRPYKLKGKTLTYSVLFRAANRMLVQVWRTTSTGSVSLIASDVWINDLFVSLTFKMPEDLTDSDKIRFVIQTQNSISLIDAKLEFGNTQTLCYQQPNGDYVLIDPVSNNISELVACQNYQVVYGYPSGGFTNATFIATGYMTSENTARLHLVTPAPLRALPTVQQTGLSILSNKNKRATIEEMFVVWPPAQNHIVIQVKIASGTGMAIGDIVFLELHSGSKLILDANLN